MIPTDLFPQKLLHLLEHDDTNCLQWFEDGTGFRILNPKLLEEKIIRKYFMQSKIRSFFRQLNVYGFVRESDPMNMSKYCFKHPSFQRNHPELIETMSRRKPSFRRRVPIISSIYASSTEDDSDSTASSTKSIPESSECRRTFFASNSRSTSVESEESFGCQISTVFTAKKRNFGYMKDPSVSFGVEFGSSKSMFISPTQVSMDENMDVGLNPLDTLLNDDTFCEDDLELLQQVLLMPSSESSASINRPFLCDSTSDPLHAFFA